MTTERKKYVIEGEVFWYTPFKTDPYLEDKYSITIGNLTKASQKLLDDLDINITDATELENEKNHDQGMRVRWKSDYPIKTIDKNKEAWPEDVLIGNGSKVRVVFFPYQWKYKSKTGVRGVPTTCQVIDLVEYVPNRDADILDEFEEAPFDADPPKKAAQKKTRVIEELNDDLSDILPE